MSTINYDQLVKQLWGDEYYQPDPGYEWSNSRKFDDSGGRSGIYAIASSVTLTNRAMNAGNVGSSQEKYTLSEGTASLLKGKYVTLDAGSFAVTGLDAAVWQGDGVSAAVGAFAVTGVDATFYVNLNRAVPQPYSYAITGVNATLRKAAGGTAYTMTAATGSIALTGKDSTLTK